MPRKITKPRIIKVGVVDEGANLEPRFPIVKGKTTMDKELLEAALETPVDGEEDIVKDLEGEAAEKMRALYRVSDALGLRDAITKSEQEALPETPEAPEDNEMNEDIQKQFDDLNAKLDASETKREELKKQLDTAQDEAELNSWIQKAKDNLQYVPGTFEDHAKELHAVAKVDKDLAEKQFARLCDVSKKLETSDTFKAIGSRGATEVAAEELISKKAKEYRDAGVSALEAYRKAVKDSGQA